MKKIIAIPDLHLDKSFTVTYGNALIWEKRPYKIIKDILKKEIGSKNDQIVFLGDIFNTVNPSFHSIFKFLSVIESYNVTIVSGNHDVPKTKKNSVMDYLHDYVSIVDRNSVGQISDTGTYAIGWCDTQSMFAAKLKATLDHIENTTVFLHASYPGWDNEMDNCLTKSLLALAKKKKVKLISGHEHNSHTTKDTLFHLGAIMPMNIGELGSKYYWTSSDNLVPINHGVGEDVNDDIILSRDDIGAQGDKPVTVRPRKTVTDDFALDEKELTIDILDDFKTEALVKGFDEEFIKEFL